MSPVGDADLLDALRANPVRPRRPGYSPISLTWRGEPIGVPYPERVLSRGAALAALKHPDGVREAFSPESYLAYLDASNVMLVNPADSKPSRIRTEERDGKRVRVFVRGGEPVPEPAAG